MGPAKPDGLRVAAANLVDVKLDVWITQAEADARSRAALGQLGGRVSRGQA